MSGSTQPVAQTWRATEPRYPPHGISYPVQIARPHTVSKGCVCPWGHLWGLLLSPSPREGWRVSSGGQPGLPVSPEGTWGATAETTGIWNFAESLSSPLKAGKVETGARLSWDLCLSEPVGEFAYKHGAPAEYSFLAAQPPLGPFLLFWGVGGHCWETLCALSLGSGAHSLW